MLRGVVRLANLLYLEPHLNPNSNPHLNPVIPSEVEGLGGPKCTDIQTLLRRIVIQILAEPALDFVNVHGFALTIVNDLITLDLSENEIARFRVREVKAAHARSRPHRKRFRELHSGIRLYIEQTP